MSSSQFNQPLLSADETPAPLHSNVAVSQYESGASWYFSNSDTRSYTGYFARGLDWLGRKLSFLRRNEYEFITHKTNQTPGLFASIKKISWDFGFGGILGAPGALLRYTASKIGSSKGRHEKKNNLVISNYALDDAERVHHSAVLNPYTLNVACLPRPKLPFVKRYFIKQINHRILRDNATRCHEIADHILANGSTTHVKSDPLYNGLTPTQQQKTDAILQKITAEKAALDEEPAILSFQEAFDESSRAILINRLKEKYPYVVHHVGNKLLNAGSGLMIFSKYPIVDAEFHAYTNTMLGEESIANKGYLGVKIQINPDRFVTVYNSHTQSGGSFYKRLSTWWNGTTGQRRGVEFGEISAHMEKWEKIAPKSAPHLSYYATVLTGDLNTNLHDKRRMLSESAGTSGSNGFKRGDIKYPGQHALFSRFYPTVASNFIDMKESIPTVADERVVYPLGTPASSSAGKQQGKSANESNRQIRACADLFTGTAPADRALEVTLNAKANIPNDSSKPKIIDGMFVSQSTKYGEHDFFSRIETVGNSSDHNAIRGSLRLR